MRNTFIAASALCGFAAAAPQMINIAAALAVPTPTAGLGPMVDKLPGPVTYNQAAAAKSAAAAVATGGIQAAGAKLKRGIDDACALQPGGYVELKACS